MDNKKSIESNNNILEATEEVLGFVRRAGEYEDLIFQQIGFLSKGNINALTLSLLVNIAGDYRQMITVVPLIWNLLKSLTELNLDEEARKNVCFILECMRVGILKMSPLISNSFQKQNVSFPNIGYTGLDGEI